MGDAMLLMHSLKDMLDAVLIAEARIELQ